MRRVAFLVEGFLEANALRSMCPRATIRRLELNGDNVSLDAIAKRIDALVPRLKDFDYIVVLFDRENRKSKVETIIDDMNNLCREIKSRNLKIIYGIPDRDIETWILADKRTIEGRCGKKPEKKLEGKKGKSTIKTMMREKGETYRESTIGAELLKKSSAPEMYKASKSFRVFAEQARETALADCWWIKGVFAAGTGQ